MYTEAGIDSASGIPQLRRREPGRLVGSDGEKMSRARGNTLTLGASRQQVEQFAQRLVGNQSTGPRDYFSNGPGPTEAIIHECFGGPASADSTGLRGRERVDALVTTLSVYLDQIRSRKSLTPLRDPEHVQNLIRTSEELAEAEITHTLVELGLSGAGRA